MQFFKVSPTQDEKPAQATSLSLTLNLFQSLLQVCMARFRWWGDYRGVFCEKLPPCLIKPVPADSKMVPPLPKAKSISDRGSASVITYLRREREKLEKRQGRERSKAM